MAAEIYIANSMQGPSKMYYWDLQSPKFLKKGRTDKNYLKIENVVIMNIQLKEID